LPPKVDRCVQSLLADPKFKPQKGKTKEQSAWALCNWLNSQGKLSHPVELVIEKAYSCECLSCGHTMTTEKHCRDIKCPKCGGEMRRKERPGVGAKLPLGGTEVPVNRTIIETEITDEGADIWMIKS
jgi:predicted RNA-binding Zn-ribbon protein involved in translation (DUF1610 family)